jgi:hypothetical protein
MLPVVAAAQQFVYDPGALPPQNVWSNGVTTSDVDGDGDEDLLFANGSAYGGTGAAGSQPQHLFLNDGLGVFSAAHAQLNTSPFNAQLVIAEDVDDDGDEDLLYASGSTGSRPRLLINQGGLQGGLPGSFLDESVTRIPALALRSFGICGGDVDGDGDVDVVVTDGGTFGGFASQARLLENNGSGFFSDATAARMPVDLYNAQDVTLVDYDGDFDEDILLSGKGGAGKRSRLYLNDGSGLFSVSSVLDGLGTGNTYEIDWADLDGDGDYDGAVQSISGINEGWSRNDGGGVAPPQMTFPAPNGQDDNEMACLDYDDDGDLDVFVGSLGGTEKLYRNDGGGVFSNHNAAIQAQSDSTLDMAFADLDSDGDYDMITAQGESGNFTNKVYRNVGPAKDTKLPDVTVIGAPDLTQPATTFKVKVKDAVADDGKVNVRVVYEWKAYSGSVLQDSKLGKAKSVGADAYSVTVPTDASTTHITVRWYFADACDNISALTVAAALPVVPLLAVPIETTIRIPILGLPVTAEIGDIILKTNGASNMQAEFRLSPEFAYLDDWYDFRWINIVTSYSENGIPLDTDPVVGDLPNMDPRTGQNAPGSLPNGLGDDVPFYYNEDNWTTGPTGTPAGIHVEGKGSIFTDTRFSAVGSRIVFNTYLVVHDKTAAQMADDSFCPLGGFAWIYENDGVPAGGEVSIAGVLDADVDAINTALAFALPDFPFWLAEECPSLQACWDPLQQFFDLANELSGLFGPPQVEGMGTLLPLSPVSLVVSGAHPLTPAYLVLGLSDLFAPFKGGVLVPSPDFIFPPLVTDGAGGLVLASTWPAGLPPGVSSWWQFWLADPGAPAGFAATNGLLAVTP